MKHQIYRLSRPSQLRSLPPKSSGSVPSLPLILPSKVESCTSPVDPSLRLLLVPRRQRQDCLVLAQPKLLLNTLKYLRKSRKAIAAGPRQVARRLHSSLSFFLLSLLSDSRTPLLCRRFNRSPKEEERCDSRSPSPFRLPSHSSLPLLSPPPPSHELPHTPPHATDQSRIHRRLSSVWKKTSAVIRSSCLWKAVDARRRSLFRLALIGLLLPRGVDLPAQHGLQSACVSLALPKWTGIREAGLVSVDCLRGRDTNEWIHL